MCFITRTTLLTGWYKSPRPINPALIVQDPESLEDLQNASYSGRSRDFSTLGGEYASAISSKLKDKFSRKVEPNFQSFLFNDQPDSEQEKGEKDKSRLVPF